MRETSDPYTYPGSEVLRNIPGIRDPERLAAFEADVTAARLVELDASPLNGNFDAGHLRAIHRYIFQDIYPWAGEYRTVNISKGGQFFGAAAFAGQALDAALQELPGEGYLTGLDSRTFASRAAFYMSEINAIHPFRDGNGRAQREFTRQLGLGAGLALDWGAVTAVEMMAASAESFTTGNSATLAGAGLAAASAPPMNLLPAAAESHKSGPRRAVFGPDWVFRAIWRPFRREAGGSGLKVLTVIY